MIHKPKTKTIYILATGIILLATACSHSSGEGSSTPTTFGTELVIPSTLTTLSDTDFERILGELEERGIPTEEASTAVISAFEPGSPEWNTLVIREAERDQLRVLRFNKCYTSLDVFYDFDNSDMTPIEKSIELSLRYNFEFSVVANGWVIFGLFNSPVEQYEILFSDTNTELSEEDPPDFERIKTFYDEVHLILFEVLGDRNLHSLLNNFTYETLPFLKQGFADIGFESSDAGISKFEDVWAANPEMARMAQVYLSLIEITEAKLLKLLEDNDEVFFLEFSDLFYFPLLKEFYDTFGEEVDSLIRGFFNGFLMGLSNNEKYGMMVNAFLEPIAKQPILDECSTPDFS